MMKLHKWPRAAGSILKSAGLSVFFTAAVMAASSTMAQEQPIKPGAGETPQAAYAFAKMMDPNTWMQMMTMSMDPRIWMNPISGCVACHDNEDVGRYQQVFGPFTAMMNPAMMSNPDVYNEMMASAMNAKAAEHWQRAVEEKYGLEPGDPMPTMHGGWPWSIMPAVPVTPPAQ